MVGEATETKSTKKGKGKGAPPPPDAGKGRKGKGAPPPPKGKMKGIPDLPLTPCISSRSHNSEYVTCSWKVSIIKAKNQAYVSDILKEDPLTKKIVNSPLYHCVPRDSSRKFAPVKNAQGKIFIAFTELQKLNPSLSSLKYYFGKQQSRQTTVVERAEVSSPIKSVTCGKRQKSILVFLASIGKKSLDGIQKLRQAIYETDYSIVNVNLISNLQNLIPTSEEVGNINSLIKSRLPNSNLNLVVENLDLSEQFIFIMSRVEQLKERLDAMLVDLTFDEIHSDCLEKFNDMYDCLSLILRHSQFFNKFFTTIVQVGNIVNRDTSIPEADILALDVYQKLITTKSSKHSDISLLHYIVSLLDEAEIENLVSSLRIKIKNTAKLNLEKLYAETTEFAETVYKLSQGLESWTKLPDRTHDGLPQRLRQFVRRVVPSVARLLHLAHICSEGYEVVTQFLGNASRVSTSKDNSLFRSLHDFVNFLEKSQFDKQIPKIRNHIRGVTEDPPPQKSARDRSVPTPKRDKPRLPTFKEPKDSDSLSQTTPYEEMQKINETLKHKNETKENRSRQSLPMRPPIFCPRQKDLSPRRRRWEKPAEFRSVARQTSCPRPETKFRG